MTKTKNKFRIVNKVLLIVLGIVSITSCYYDNAEELYGTGQKSCDTSVVTFSQDVSIIINNNCAFSGCHLGTNAAAGIDLSTYGSVSANATEIRNRINLPSGAVGLMPPTGRLNQCDIDKINAWIDMGAMNN